MGLDIFIYRITKPEELDDRVYSGEDLRAKGLTAIPAEYLKCSHAEDLAPYCREIKAAVQHIDIERIRQDYELPDTAEVVMWSGDGSICVSTDSAESDYIDISHETLTEKYLLTKIEAYAAFKKEEVAYWRKDYDVSDFFCERIGKQVDNTGFYLLSRDLLREFNESFNEDVPEEEPDEKSGIFYWEWY